ncbi:hypothetical protein OUZ56_032162 [Daphnia magna]|uniref:Secreted protein n=1 Tax=Daphnia magna TaxID=35525 RepID=A0ABQ9ZWN8_9CRUS|nr:hypothetical protein OUZ56_032162 [Daphnia magna]
MMKPTKVMMLSLTLLRILLPPARVMNQHRTHLKYAVRKGSNSRDGIKRCPESALEESPSGELPELGSVRGAPWFPKRSSDASPTFDVINKRFPPSDVDAQEKLIRTTVGVKFNNVAAKLKKQRLLSDG